MSGEEKQEDRQQQDEQGEELDRANNEDVQAPQDGTEDEVAEATPLQEPKEQGGLGFSDVNLAFLPSARYARRAGVSLASPRCLRAA